jgi:hypothetical protein
MYEERPRIGNGLWQSHYQLAINGGGDDNEMSNVGRERSNEFRENGLIYPEIRRHVRSYVDLMALEGASTEGSLL